MEGLKQGINLHGKLNWGGVGDLGRSGQSSGNLGLRFATRSIDSPTTNWANKLSNRQPKAVCLHHKHFFSLSSDRSSEPGPNLGCSNFLINFWQKSLSVIEKDRIIKGEGP